MGLGAENFSSDNAVCGKRLVLPQPMFLGIYGIFQ
jgi:hypothetical protein